MIEKPQDIDFFTDLLGAMMQQSEWAFNNSIKFGGTPDGERFWLTYLFWDKKINEYLEENQAS